jgi:xanthine/CO dehydrogenase XdhC/CoxF family maturation factor
MTVTYDLRDEADELFGLGIGCNGLISVLLQPVTPAGAYEPMASIATALLGDRTAGIATIVAADDAAAPAGASVISMGSEVRSFHLPSNLLPLLRERAQSAGESRAAGLVEPTAGLRILFAPLEPIPRVLILGAGLDAVPLVNVIAELGWRVAVADHRPAYLARGGFARAESLHQVRADTLAEDLNLAAFDAIVVMSHHLRTDLDYLRQLAGVQTPYLGLLGPPARRQRLLDDLGETAAALRERLRGPVGIDIGADSAESIALSIAAEMQSALATGVVSDFRRKA